jgi:SAM-dependent methyltransferase
MLLVEPMTVLTIDFMTTARRRIAATSDTLRLGFLRGFESGELIDRIYHNRPTGRFVIGALIDAYVLRLPAAEALRDRKRLVRSAIRAALDAQPGPRAHAILDLGCGTARYVTEALTPLRKQSRDARQAPRAVCIDLDSAALRAGRDIARDERAGDISFVCRDALNIEALAGYAPTIVVASGLFDHIDDERMRSALHAIRRHLRPHALILSTRTAVTRPGDPLDALLAAATPRTRPAAAVEAWLRAAGFDDITITYTSDGTHAVFAAR